jgi:hypothetical protein
MIDIPYGVTQMAVINETGKIYLSYVGSTTDMTFRIGEVDVETLALSMPVSTTLTAVAGVTSTPGPYHGGITTDGTFVYAATGAPISQVFKYRISDWALISTYNNTVAGRLHNIVYDGQFLYITSYQNGPSTGGGTNNARNYVAKINANTMTQVAINSTFPTSFSSAGYVNVGFTDDLAVVGDYLYLGCDWNTLNGAPFVKVNKNNLADVTYIIPPSLSHLTGLSSNGLWFDGTYIWAAINNDTKTTGYISRIDPITDEIVTTVLPAGETWPNEIASDGHRLFTTHFLTPAIVTRYYKLLATFNDTKATTSSLGAATFAVTTRTAAYTALPTDYTILANATSAAFTITLPTSVGKLGRVFVIKKTDASANAVTVATTASQTIDGVTTRVLAAQYERITVQSDGANWQII